MAGLNDLLGVVGGGLGGLGGVVGSGTVFRAYAETTIGTPGGALTRRFLLTLDPSAVTTGAAAIDNYLDVNDAAPKPDLKLRLTPNASLTQIKIDIRPHQGRVLTGLTLAVYIALDGDVYGGPAQPSTFAFVEFRGTPVDGAPARAFPPMLTAVLDRPTPGADETIQLSFSTTDCVEPLALEAGTFKGPLITPAPNARTTAFVGGVYSEPLNVQIRAGNRQSPTEAVRAELRASDRTAANLALDPLSLKLTSPYVISRPRRTTTATLAGQGAGSVDRGAHSYRVTFVLQNGNETSPSLTTAPIEVADPAANGRVRLGSIPIGAAQGNPALNVVRRRIYRSLAGDRGEHFRVGEIADNSTTQFVDNVPDSALGEPLPGRMAVEYRATTSLDLRAVLRTKDGETGAEDRIEASVEQAPTTATAIYDNRATPRLTYTASALFGLVDVTLPTLAGPETTYARALIRGLPAPLTVHWRLDSENKSLIALGGSSLASPAEPIDSLALVLAHGPSALPAGRQPVAVEILDQRQANGTITRLHTRIAVLDLRRLRLALGEAGTHARENDGLKLLLAHGRPATTRERSLRFLRHVDRHLTGEHEHSRLWVRAGSLPPQAELDLRASGGYLGLRVQGSVRRLKVLALTAPKSAWESDRARLWLAVPETGERIDFVSDAFGQRLESDRALGAELSLRDPSAPERSANAFRHLKALLWLPANAQLHPARVAYGTADAGSTATQLADADANFDPAWRQLRLRWRSGALAGQRRDVVSIADATHLTTQPFSAGPVAGDRYAIEGRPVEGIADAGTNATQLVDADGNFDTAWQDMTLTYTNGPRQGESRRITAVADASHLTTEGFGRSPRAGDAYVIEGPSGLTLETGEGRPVEGIADAGTNFTQLVDADGSFDTAWRGMTLTYTSGPQKGATRRITAVADTSHLTTERFGGLPRNRPRAGDAYAIKSAGAAGRLALGREADKLAAVRATPQMRLRNAPPVAPASSSLHGATARVLGVGAFNLMTWGALTEAHAELGAVRLNESLRVALDERMSAADPPRDVLKLRVSSLPADGTLRLGPGDGVYELLLSKPSGAGSLWAEPRQQRKEDVRSPIALLLKRLLDPLAPERGIGLIEFSFDAIPRGVRLSLLADASDELFSRLGWQPPTGWEVPAIRVDASGGATLRFLRMIAYSRDREPTWLPVSNRNFFWTRTDAKLVSWTRQNPAAPGADTVFLWSPGEIEPADPDNKLGGIGYQISPNLLLTVDLDSYGARTQDATARWDSFQGTWRLEAELQMQRYSGACLIAAPSGRVAGDEHAGLPGRWFLRSINGRPWYVHGGSVFFGNTRGALPGDPALSKPRIFQ